MVALLEVDRLSVSLGGKDIVVGASFALEPGERLGLTGPSGAGKTTLLRAVSGLIDASAGAVRYRGQVPEGDGLPGFRGAVVYVSQTPSMLEVSLEENLRLPFSHAAIAAEWDRGRATVLLSAVGVDPARMSQAARELSVGQAQRAALVRALLLRPAVLLLDEPTSALDDQRVALVETLLIETSDTEGTGIVIVSHRHEQVARLCHRTVDLSDSLRGHLL
jgi:putative ABC transport system ATP-binding protein